MAMQLLEIPGTEQLSGSHFVSKSDASTVVRKEWKIVIKPIQNGLSDWSELVVQQSGVVPVYSGESLSISIPPPKPGAALVFTVDSTTTPSGPVDKTRNDFLEAAYLFSSIGKSRHGVDWVIDKLDDLLNDGQFAECNAIFCLAAPDKLSDPLIVTFLGITFAAPRNQLPARSAFYRRAFQVVSTRRGMAGAERLLEKYR